MTWSQQRRGSRLRGEKHRGAITWPLEEASSIPFARTRDSITWRISHDPTDSVATHGPLPPARYNAAMHDDLIAQLSATPSTLATLSPRQPRLNWTPRRTANGARGRSSRTSRRRVPLHARRSRRMLAEETPTLRFIDGGEWSRGAATPATARTGSWGTLPSSVRRACILRALQPSTGSGRADGRARRLHRGHVPSCLGQPRCGAHRAAGDGAGETLEQVRYRRARRMTDGCSRDRPLMECAIRLDDAGVAYMVTGSVAGYFYGLNRATETPTSFSTS